MSTQESAPAYVQERARIDALTDCYQHAHVEREGAYLIDFCTCRDGGNGQRVFTCMTNLKGGECPRFGKVCGGYCRECFDALMAQARADAGPDIDCDHLRRQRAWSEATFGPGRRTLGITDHIRKELVEIESDPDDWTEWIDVVILALDGAWRHGAEPRQILDAIVAKQTKNEGRVWPDWRTQSDDRAIEHDRSHDVSG